MKTPKSTYMKAKHALKDVEDIGHLETLLSLLQAQIESLEAQADESWESPDNAIESGKAATGHYALELVRCGKTNCKCASGKKEDLHGPYYYLYQYLGGGKYNPKYKKTYCGKQFPKQERNNLTSSEINSI